MTAIDRMLGTCVRRYGALKTCIKQLLLKDDEIFAVMNARREWVPGWWGCDGEPTRGKVLRTDLDLDLDSTHALGHTPTPFGYVKGCHLCFFPGERHLSQIFLDCAYPVSSWSTWSSLEAWNLPV